MALNSNKQHHQDRVVLLLDLDCFYAQCERIRLGFTDHKTCCLALLQWNSCLAVSYPARAFGIKRGDSFQDVAAKSQGKCMAVHVPLLETNASNNSIDFDGTYESNYCLTPEQQQQLRHQDIGKRRYATEGKACLERYRVASRRIFEIVQECLGMTSTNNNNSTTASTGTSMPKTGIILEKASIDEFFLDVTAICNNPNHPLWEIIQKEQSTNNASIPSDQDTSSNAQHKTVIVGTENKDDNPLDDDDPSLKTNLQVSDPALERGCQLAHYIRQSVFHKLGFTLSAGISQNKMVAKLAASYGKPNGQAIVVPALIPSVMQSTKLSKVRNFGGKLGKAILEILPPDTPPTMGSISKYLSLPQLQKHFSLETAQMIYQACRGHDNEPVEAKNTGNVVKSITAFKSLPRSASEADIEDAAFTEWLELLVKEVVSRVETDAQRNHRYPRNVTIQYGCVGHLNAAGRLNMQSFRVPFPAQRWTVAQRISHLMDIIPSKIIAREQPKMGSTTANVNSNYKAGSRRKRIRISRIGVCATEMNEEVNKHGSIANYFSAATPSATTKKSVTTTPKNASSAKESLLSPTAAESSQCDSKSPKISINPYRKKTPSPKTPAAATGSSSATPREEDDEEEDEDLKVARELQKAYDRENRTLDLMDKTCGTSSKKKQPHTASKKTVAGNPKEDALDTTAGGMDATNVASAHTFSPATGEGSTNNEPDPDLELAKRLQATYDRENRVVGAWDTVQKKRVLSNSSTRPAPKKKAKTKKISSFFQVSK